MLCENDDASISCLISLPIPFRDILRFIAKTTKTRDRLRLTREEVFFLYLTVMYHGPYISLIISGGRLRAARSLPACTHAHSEPSLCFIVCWMEHGWSRPAFSLEFMNNRSKGVCAYVESVANANATYVMTITV